MVMKKGKCINLDCEEYGHVFEVDEGKEFVCPKCGKKLYDLENEGSARNWKKILLYVLAAVIVAALASFLVVKYVGGSKEVVEAPNTKPDPDPITCTTPSDTVYITKVDTVVVQDTIWVNVVDTILVKDTVEIEVVTVLQDLSEPTKVYSFGKYYGSLKEGIPHGYGKMCYTKKVRIAKHAKYKYYAEQGDVFEGLWGNGDIESGKLYDKDGNFKSEISPGRRTTRIDIGSSDY